MDKTLLQQLHDKGYSLRRIERDTGVSHQRLSEILKGKREPTGEQILAVYSETGINLPERAEIKRQYKIAEKQINLTATVLVPTRSFSVSKKTYAKQSRRLRKTLKAVFLHPNKKLKHEIIHVKNIHAGAYQLNLVGLWRNQKSHKQKIVSSFSKAHITIDRKQMLGEAKTHAIALLGGSYEWKLVQVLQLIMREYKK